ncbi:hypothetical protein ACFV4E_22835 [Streptomyces hygroscopicus]|nr:hypothetical protein [Streptomyces hygroscopicus]
MTTPAQPTGEGVSMGKQVKCGAKTKKGTRCTHPAMIGYSRCQEHRGKWNKPQKKQTKKR